MMIKSFDVYRVLLTGSLKKLPDDKKINFGRQVARRLNDQYHPELSLRGYQKEADLVNRTFNLLSEMMDQPKSIPAGVLETNLAQLYEASYSVTSNLDLSEVYQLGRDQLINALEYVIVYVLEKKLKHLVGCAYCPFKVITLILVKAGLDMTDPDQHIDHPLFQEEISFQIEMLRNAGIQVKASS